MSLAFSEDVCPVPESLFGQLYRSHPAGLSDLVETISPNARAMLALFCYRRAHLQPLAISIASSCSEDDLVNIGGRVGSVLFEMSRQESPALLAEPPMPGRRKITLAKGPLWSPAPLEDHVDDMDIEAEIDTQPDHVAELQRV